MTLLSKPASLLARNDWLCDIWPIDSLRAFNYLVLYAACIRFICVNELVLCVVVDEAAVHSTISLNYFQFAGNDSPPVFIFVLSSRNPPLGTKANRF